MAKTSDIVRAQKPIKYEVRKVNRCMLCGRARGYVRRFGLCRLCLRDQIHKGAVPGVVKASW